jgi:hypothetical protein
VSSTDKPVDWEAAIEELRTQKTEPLYLTGKQGKGVLFSASSREEANAIWNACPSFASWASGSQKQKSDKPPPDAHEDWPAGSVDVVTPFESG